MVDSKNGAIVLLPIYPEFASAIFAGTKRIEFRRRLFKRPVKRVVVYSTQPDSMVLGHFDVESIVEKKPSLLWSLFNKVGGIDKGRFDEYYRGCELGYGIKVKRAVAYEEGIELGEIGKKAPQGYVYLQPEEALALEKAGLGA